MSAKGAAALSDPELLAVLLGASPGALEVAQRMLLELGSLRALLEADSSQCQTQFGIRPSRFAALHAALELARRHHEQTVRQRPVMRAAADIRAFLLARLADKRYEVFCAMFLDAHWRLIEFAELFRGTLDGAEIYVKEVVRQAISHNAHAVVFSHNHPSGSAEPSEADIIATHLLRDALACVDVQVADHIVVGHAGCTSLAQRGVLNASRYRPGSSQA